MELNEINNNRIFTGFFMRVNLNKKQYFFLLTCEHSLPQEYINSKTTINVYHGKYKEEEKIEIKLDINKRIIKCYKDLDVILIEILEEDNIPNEKFLFPDLNYQNDGFSFYKDSQVYTAGYPDVNVYKGEKHMSSGIIKTINEYDFEHTCDTRKGSSGSPIININKQVIGIHYGGSKKKDINYGFFIGAIIDKMEKEGKIERHKNSINYINDSNNNKENPKNNNDNPKLNIDKNTKNFLINTIPLMQPFLTDPNYLRNFQIMYKDPTCRGFLKEIPAIKNMTKNNPDLFNKMQDPNIFISGAPTKEDLDKNINVLKDEKKEEVNDYED